MPGGVWVRYQYAASFVVATVRSESDPVWRPDRRRGRFLRSWPYSLVTLLFGWWGLPWGVRESWVALMINWKGGRVVSPTLDDEADG